MKPEEYENTYQEYRAYKGFKLYEDKGEHMTKGWFMSCDSFNLYATSLRELKDKIKDRLRPNAIRFIKN